MAFVERASPELGSFNYALVRFDWPPNQVYQEAIYGEVARSRCIALPPGWKIPERVVDRLIKPRPGLKTTSAEGGRAIADGSEAERSACMMFVTQKHLRTRLQKLGWLEVTEQWAEYVAQLNTEEVERLKKLAADKEKIKPVGRPMASPSPEKEEEDPGPRSNAERVTNIPARGRGRRTVSAADE